MMSPVAGPQTAKHIFGQPAAPNLNVHLLCPNCKEDPPNLVEEYAKGDIVCGSCGMVLGDRIVDTRSEWRTFAGDENGDDPSRVGDSSNPLLKETFDTQISSHDGGKGIARDLQRAANRQVHGPGNKSNALLSAAFSKLNEKAEMMQLPRAVVLQAQQIYSIGFEQNLIRGKDTDAAIGACLILGCRSAKVDRTLLEVANLVKVNKKKIGQALLALNPVVNKTRAGSGHLTTINNAEQQIQNIVARVVNYLGQPHEVQKAANHIAGAAADMEGVAGRSPVSIAAGILWFACLLYERDRAEPPVTAKRISELAKVSDSTIKFICKKISSKIEQVIKPEWATLSGYEALAALGRTEVAGNGNKASRTGSRAATPKEEVPGSPKSPKSDTSTSAKDEKS